MRSNNNIHFHPFSAFGADDGVLPFFVRKLNGNAAVRAFAVSCCAEILESILQQDQFGFHRTIQLEKNFVFVSALSIIL